MECAEIRSGFVAGSVPAGRAVDVHLQSCPHCRELFKQGAVLGRRLAQAGLPEVETGDLFSLVDRDLRGEVGVRARLRALPTRVRAGALVGAAIGLLLWQLVLRRRPDFAAYSATVFWGVVALLGAALLSGSRELVRGVSAPLRSPARQRWFAIALLMAPAVASLLVPLGSSDEGAAWGSPSLCFGYGALLVAPLLVLYWSFERRDVVPVAARVSAGAVAGIAANLLLYAHCPALHLGHLLLGHATIGVAWALALGLLPARFGRLRDDR